MRVVRWQLAVAALGGLLWLVGGLEAALAAWVGGTASALLSLQFAIRALSPPPEAPPQRLLGAFLRAEAFKLVLAAVFFSVTARYFGHLFVPVLTTFVATLPVFWIALLWAPQTGRGRVNED